MGLRWMLLIGAQVAVPSETRQSAQPAPPFGESRASCFFTVSTRELTHSAAHSLSKRQAED